MTRLYTEERGSLEELQPEPPPPPAPISTCQTILLMTGFLGFHAMFMLVCVVAVPAQIEAMVNPVYKGRWSGGLVAGGAIVMFLAGPLVGLKSDRMVSRFGKRRPIMVVSSLFTCASLLGAAFSAPEIIIKRPLDGESECHIDLAAQRCARYNTTVPEIYDDRDGNMPQGPGFNPHINVIIEKHGAYEGNLALFVIFFLMATLGMVGFTIPYNALIADKSVASKRGFNSGVMGFMILFGNICGAALGFFFVQMGVFVVYGSVVALMVVCTLVTALSVQEEPGKEVHEPIQWLSVFKAFWEPLLEYDFRWVFITRFLMQQGISTVTSFLEYWLADMIPLPNCWSPQRAVALLMVPMLCTAALGSIICGVISDKTGRRKILVLAAALLMSSVSLIFAFIKGPNAFYVSAAFSFIFGTGFGAYGAVDFALVMDVLAEDKDKAKDLAVWTQALILPQVIATPIGGLVIDLFNHVNCRIGLGYMMLFVIAAFYLCLSGFLVLKIRKAR